MIVTDRNTTDTISGSFGATPAIINAASEVGNTVTATASGFYSIGQQITIANLSGVNPATSTFTYLDTNVGLGTATPVAPGRHLQYDNR